MPKEKRVHGYYTMPLLAGGQIVGRVDPARDGKTLVAKQVSLDRAARSRPWPGRCAEAAPGWAATPSASSESSLLS